MTISNGQNLIFSHIRQDVMSILPKVACNFWREISNGVEFNFKKSDFYQNCTFQQCTMRINARANPPTAPQFALPSQPPSKCLDISTTNKGEDAGLQIEENNVTLLSKSSHVKKKWQNLKNSAVADNKNELSNMMKTSEAE